MPRIRDINPVAAVTLSVFRRQLEEARLAGLRELRARQIRPPKGWVYVGAFTPYQ